MSGPKLDKSTINDLDDRFHEIEQAFDGEVSMLGLDPEDKRCQVAGHVIMDKVSEAINKTVEEALARIEFEGLAYWPDVETICEEKITGDGRVAGAMIENAGAAVQLHWLRDFVHALLPATRDMLKAELDRA
jgi:hypothetical protein